MRIQEYKGVRGRHMSVHYHVKVATDVKNGVKYDDMK